MSVSECVCVWGKKLEQERREGFLGQVEADNDGVGGGVST